MTEKFDPKPYVKFHRMTPKDSDRNYVRQPSAEDLKIQKEVREHFPDANKYVEEAEAIIKKDKPTLEDLKN